MGHNTESVFIRKKLIIVGLLQFERKFYYYHARNLITVFTPLNAPRRLF